MSFLPYFISQVLKCYYPARIAAVIDFVFSHPSIIIKQLETVFDMPIMATKHYVEKLVDEKGL